jgi:hypothetical protein
MTFESGARGQAEQPPARTAIGDKHKKPSKRGATEATKRISLRSF